MVVQTCMLSSHFGCHPCYAFLFIVLVFANESITLACISRLQCGWICMEINIPSFLANQVDSHNFL